MPETQEQTQTNDGSQAPKEGDFGPNFEQLPEPIKESLRDLRNKASKREMYARVTEISMAVKQRFMYRGIQNTWWNNDEQRLMIGPTGGGVSDSSAATEPHFYKAFNIYLGYAKSFMAVFCQNNAAVRFQPENPKDSIDIRAAETANKMKRVVEKFNDPRQIQMDIARLLWTDGRVVAHTRYVTDGQRFGFDSEGKPKGREVTDVFGVLETKVPLNTRDKSQWPYIGVSGEFDVTTVKASYPHVAKDIHGKSAMGGPEQQLARNARVGTAEGTPALSQDALAHLATVDKFWFRPSFYWELEDEKRKQLEQFYPQGCFVVFSGDTYCESRNEALDDHIEVMHALPGDGQDRPSLGNPEVPVQLEFNDMMNLVSEAIKYTIPATWVDQDAVDIDAIQDQQAEYGAHYPFQRKNGESAANHFYTEEAIEPPATVATYLENLQGPLSQFLTGQQPALFGAQMEDQKTARGYAMARDQALGLMALVWVPFKKFYASVMLQAVKAGAQNRTSDILTEVPIPGKQGMTEPISVAIEDLEGNVLCYPETDENFPESWTQKSNKFMQLMMNAEANPVLYQWLQDPNNLAMAKDMIGLPDFTIPGQESRDKQLREITEMRNQPPVPTPNLEGMAENIADTSMGNPVQEQPPVILKSSVEVDPIFDDHAVEFQECKDWLNSDEGQKAKVNEPEWFMNVRLHALEHYKFVQQALATAAAIQPPPDSRSPKGTNPESPQAPQVGQPAA